VSTSAAALGLTLLGLAGGCGRLGFDPFGDDEPGDSAAALIDAGPPDAACALGEWGAPERLGGNVNGADDEGGAWLSADGEELIFSRAMAGGDATLVRATRTTPGALDYTVDPTQASLVFPNAAPGAHDNAFVSADGLTLWHDIITGGTSGAVVVHTRSALDQPFLSPTPLTGAGLPADGVVCCVDLTADELTAALAYRRPGIPDDYDIFLGTRTSLVADFTFSPPEPALQTLGFECCGTWSHDGASLVYAQGAGDIQLYRAPFDGTALAAGGEVLEVARPAGALESDPHASRDGQTLLFSSNRPGSSGRDLWMIRRTCGSP